MTEEIEIELPEVEDQEDSLESKTPERDYVAEATKQGWRPPSELKDPSRGLDAKTFVERGEEFAPFIKAKAKEVESKNAELEHKLAEQELAIERNNRITEKLIERAKQEALELNARERKTAWEQGDDAKYDELDKKRDTIGNEFKIEPAKSHTEVIPKHAAVSKFEQENPWYGQDMILTKNADDLDAALIASNRFTSVEARHAEVKRQIVEAFPHKFANPNREIKTGLGTGRSPAKSSSNKKGWDAMPEADKKVAAGFLKGGKSKEDYAKTYWEMIKEDENA